MIPLLGRPPPHSSLPSLFKLGVEQTGLFSREGRTAVDYTLPPPLVFIHHLPLFPCPLSHYLPHPNPMVPQELSLLVHPWNNLLIVIIVCASEMLCLHLIHVVYEAQGLRLC